VATGVIELSELTLFEGCSPHDLERLSEAVTGAREIAEGSVLCREGETADRWWIVVEGTAEVTIGGLYVATIGPGESIGELALLDGEIRNATVTAGSDMVVQEVDGTRFLELLAQTPDVTLALLRELAVRLRVTNQLTVRPVPGGHDPGVAATRAPPPARRAVAVTFNPFAPGYFADPYEQYAALRQNDPVHLDRLTGAYLLTRYDDVHRLARDRSLTVGIDHAVPTPVLDAERARDVAGGGVSQRMMLRRDGEDHVRLRRLVTRAFTPKAIAAWRERTELVVDRLLTDLEERDSVDVVDEFAARFPDRIISEMLGMPAGDAGQYRTWSEAITKTMDPLNSPREESDSVEASRAMASSIEGIIESKRTSPADDILTDLIHAEESGDQLSRDEVVAQVMLLYAAGHENARNLVGNGLVHLFEFPDQLDLLRSNPSLDTNAIEECIRFDSPVQFSRRIVVEPIELDDVEIAPGSVLLLGLGAANRDPDKWGPTADVLNLARPRANEHASFGGGPHHCLGSALARLEAQVALPTLVRRFPRLAPSDEGPTWGARMMLRGVESLRVELRGA
jgi:cytochrome P450